MHRGFTLIELLVVITIIVVLLALLTPALDRAIYQAELAVCAARQKAIASSVQLYAAANRRRYPHRPNMQGEYSGPHFIWNGTAANTDDRPYLMNAMNINDLLNDPFCETVDYVNAEPGSQIYASYYMWFGFRYTANPGAGMYKMGDRFTWNEENVRYRFSTLVSENDDIRIENAVIFNGHPDYDGTLTSRSYQDVGGVTIGIGGLGGAANYVVSRWENQGGSILRGGEDMHYAYDDGSVRRINNVRLNSDADPDPGDRVVRTGGYTGDPDTLTQWTLLPRE